MLTDEQLEKLEEEEHDHAVEEFALLVLLLSDLFVDLEKELSLFYKKYGKDGKVTYLQSRKRISERDKRKRITALLLTIDGLFDKSFEAFESNMESHLRYILERENDFFDTDIDLDEILSTPWGDDKRTWRDRLWSYKKQWLNVIGKDLKQHFLKQSEYEDVIDSLDDRFESMERILWRLYESESTATNSIARQQIFKELGAKKYRVYTRVDERRCELCGSFHGRVFPMSAYEVGVTASPFHSHCRCWEVPILED